MNGWFKVPNGIGLWLSRLTGLEAKVLLAVLRGLDGRKDARIGTDWIAAVSGIHRRTVYRARDALVEKGLLCIDQAPRGRGRRARYSLGPVLNDDHAGNNGSKKSGGTATVRGVNSGESDPKLWQSCVTVKQTLIETEGAQNCGEEATVPLSGSDRQLALEQFRDSLDAGRRRRQEATG